MKRVVIERFEGIYAICEDDDKGLFAIEVSEMPQGAKEGSVIDITDDGELLLNQEETNVRRDRIFKKQSGLFSD